MAYYLGIDGGGSKTSCLLGDAESVLGMGKSSGSNLIRVERENTQEALVDGIKQACDEAMIGAREISRTCMGVAGGARSETAEVVRSILRSIVGGEIQVVGDMEIALMAAFGHGPGAIVIAGTGSIAYGRNGSGETARAGGWGYAISDEGSGHWIGRSAIAGALRSFDVSRDSKLLDMILKEWHLRDREELVMKSNSSPPPHFAALMPVVQACAEAGDALAEGLLERAGIELAELGNIVIERLFKDNDGVPMAMSGGVFENSPQVRQSFYNRVRKPVALACDVVEPVKGALEMARRA